MKTTFTYDHYYKYEEIKSNLEYFAKTYPDIVKLEVNAVTAENRNQYVVTLTNQKTGADLEKPGWYLDGNIHAGEVTASMAAMHTIDYLVTNYGSDATVTKLLDQMTIYVIPRVSPDGAETYLTTPYNLRSINQAYHPQAGGVKPEDLDGDGVVRMMRIPTPYGAWKKDPNDDSVMLKRSPSDWDGEFYDIYPEGVLEAFDGDENLKQKKNDWSRDYNRNFPYGWFPDGRQPGAGEYPLCAIETKAIVDFALAHPNIGGAAIGHTSGGVILYPPGTRTSKSANAGDIHKLIAIANMGKEELGYEPLNIFDSFVHDQTNYDSGALDDWFFQSEGVPAYTVEFWDVAKRAGAAYNFGHEGETPEKASERFYAIMKWVKENAPQYYVDWKPIEHPTFGAVEIGGFNTKFSIQNPPESFLTELVEQDTKFNIRFAQAMPHLVIDSTAVETVSEDVYKVTAVVGNLGYLPTNLTEEANFLKKNGPVSVTIEGAEVVFGKEKEEIGNLAGYSDTVTGAIYGNLTTFANAKAKKKVSWMVKAPKGTVVTLTAQSEKAGKAAATIELA